MEQHRLKKGKQHKFVNNMVKTLDEEFSTGENLFGDKPDDVEIGKVKHIIQLGNIINDRVKFLNPQETRVNSPKGTSPTLTLAYPPLFLVKDGPDDYRVRRLTGVECMRLMGVEEEDIQKLVDGGISNTQLAQLAGNSIVVDVMSDFYKEMIKH